MKAIIFALLAGACWGVGELCTRSVLHGRQVGPMAVLLVRIAIALLPALLAFWIAAHRLGTEPQAFWKADGPTLIKLFVGSGILAGFGGVMFFYLALNAGEIGVVKPIAFTIAPALAALLGWILLGETMGLRKFAGLTLIIAGIVLLTLAPAPQPPAPTSSQEFPAR